MKRRWGGGSDEQEAEMEKKESESPAKGICGGRERGGSGRPRGGLGSQF